MGRVSNTKIKTTENLPDTRKFIILRGVHVNNLKNINLDVQKYKLIVFTGVSGSGKSSIVFDTIYAEGQRRYVESLSSYARQFLEKMKKPDADYIAGLAPSMAIEQKTSSRNPRSTVGTTTEIYDYLRLLYARIGVTYSPVSGKPVKKDSPQVITEEFYNRYKSEKKHKTKVRLPIIYILVNNESGTETDFLIKINELRSKGYYKIFVGDIIYDTNDYSDKDLTNLFTKSGLKSGKTKYHFKIIIDRFRYEIENGDTTSRFNDSLEMAFREGNGYLILREETDGKFKDTNYNQYLEADGIKFEEPEPRLFSFNNPFGACPKCQGFGRTMDIDYNLVIPDKNKSIIQGAIVPFTTPKHSKHLTDLILESKNYGVDVEIPFYSLTQKQKEYVFKGGRKYIGIHRFFKMIEREASYKIHYRILLNRYRAYTTCGTCGGSRLRKEALYLKINGKNIFDVVRMNITEAFNFFKNLNLTDYEKEVSERILEEIIYRLKYLLDVGLTYLTLNRLSNTLSGGESQRINLSTSLGSSLVGSVYVLDEPSIGLHPRDNEKLITILKSLRDLGNTVLVVEHDKDMICEADEIIDIGPYAGEHGGRIIFQGSYNELLRDTKSITGRFLNGRDNIHIPPGRRLTNDKTKYITIKGARENNLKNIDVKIPLGMFVCVTGVSGSGKSTLINQILYGALKKNLEGYYNEKIGEHDRIDGINNVDFTELVDQTSIGRTLRSNPVTYIKGFDEIRDLFASVREARKRNLSPGYFSFNVPGGRCEECEGTGFIKVEMQFMADILLECEACKGKRYKKDTLEIKVRGNNSIYKNISEILDLTVNEAIKFFKEYPKITTRLRVLDEVGLGYIRLGQSGSTLSGGESQRLKLAYHIAFANNYENTLFIFDEPTTGLHYYDISKLLKCFDKLIKKGNSVIVIEHNLELIKCADYIIDLGPECGDEGGYVVAKGTPEGIANSVHSHTGRFLKKILLNSK